MRTKAPSISRMGPTPVTPGAPGHRAVSSPCCCCFFKGSTLQALLRVINRDLGADANPQEMSSQLCQTAFCSLLWTSSVKLLIPMSFNKRILADSEKQGSWDKAGRLRALGRKVAPYTVGSVGSHLSCLPSRSTTFM